MKTRATSGWWALAAAALGALMMAGTAWADVAYTNSAPFSVNTVIPEPGAVAAVAIGLLAMLRRRGARDGRWRAPLALVLAGVLACVQAVRAAAPVVTDVTASQRDYTFLCDVYYSVQDADGDMVEVALYVSTNSGARYDVLVTNVSGDVGYVTTGVNKHIVWDMGTDMSNVVSTSVVVKVLVDDGCRYIPAGTFNMGTNNLPFEGEMANAGPNHAVYVSGFYMGTYEVSYEVWKSVYDWAVGKGYSFDNTGNWKAVTHPVQVISWYDAVKWCNARSEKEGLTPCYYLDAGHTVVYRTGQSNLWSGAVKWNADGYRLPTEAEWEKAARGGLVGRRFAWNDDNITHTNANYVSNPTVYPYDTSLTTSNHPTFAVLPTPYTAPVGYFLPNGYGLYGTIGDGSEWIWDWLDANYYAVSPSTDPRGPASGTQRVRRGGGWNSSANNCRAAVRYGSLPDATGWSIGFRCARGR
ncbi:MAG: formylglycine-generating enzyme family protein [bacterium]|nr:formylglycine-generating enzyme family protein [bacterium]